MIHRITSRVKCSPISVRLRILFPNCVTKYQHSNSAESPDYYEEACYYRHEWSVTRSLYLEATKEVGQLQIHLDAR
jgi:hypothetical protein